MDTVQKPLDEWTRTDVEALVGREARGLEAEVETRRREYARAWGDTPGAHELADRVIEHQERTNGDGPDRDWSDRKPLDLHSGEEPEAPDLLVEGMERGTVVAICADTGGAKSFTTQDLVVAIAMGREEWLGKKLSPRHGHVILIDEENPERLLRSRLRALGLRPEGEPYVRAYHRLGVRLGEGDWTDWLRGELDRQPADLVVIDTGIAATAPEVNDNDAVARLYTGHLRPLAAASGTVIALLLHERKPQEGARIRQIFATMGARAWIGQADTQLMLAKRGRAEEELEGGGYRLESRFVIATGKLRDGGAEVVESLRITSKLRADRALLKAEILNEGEVESDDPKVAEMLDDIVEVLVEAGDAMKKSDIAAHLGIESKDRMLTRALEKGIESNRLSRPRRGTYALNPD